MELDYQFPVTIDATMRSDYCACPRKFYWRHCLGLTPSGGTNIHLVAGAAFARAFEVFRKEFYTGTSFEDAQAMGVIALLKEYGDHDFPADESKQWPNMVDAFQSALRNWPPATDYMQPLIVHGSPAVEFSFAIPIAPHLLHPLTNDPLLFCGRFDMIGEMNGSLFGEDDKTTKALGSYWSQQWDLRSQFTGYTWGAREFGYPLAGFVIRGTAILKTKITHAEAIVYRPEWMVNRWFDRLLLTTNDMLMAYNSNLWPMTGEENGTCASYGGCPFVPLCNTPNPDQWMEGNYTVERWDPTNRGAR